MMHRPSLIIVVGGIHCDEHLQNHVGLWINHGNRRFRGECLRISLYGDDVLVSRDRPKRAHRTVRLKVHGRLCAQPREQIVPIVMLEHSWVRDIQSFERHATIIGLHDVSARIHNFDSFKLVDICFSGILHLELGQFHRDIRHAI